MKLVLDSTRKFWQEARKVANYSLFDALHGYIYTRWPYLYISIGSGEHPSTRVLFPLINFFGRAFNPISRLLKSIFPPNQEIRFADTYHGKVVPLSSARKLVQVQQDIRLENLEHVIPYQKARDLILLEPTHIGVIECPCRSARQHPCHPLDVCIIIGEPFVGMMLDHHPNRSRRITQAEALQILDEEDQRGHVHHAFFKDAMLGRFYAICNCCSCCCAAIESQRKGTQMLASSGYLAQVDEAACMGCGVCEDRCLFHAITLDQGVSRVDASACMGCGACVSGCTQQAIHLVLHPANGIPLELDQLLSSVTTSIQS
jgi:ferredoxin